MSHPVLLSLAALSADPADGPMAPFDPASTQSWLDWFVGLPLRVLLIVGIGSVVLALVRRVIRKVTEHIAEGGSPSGRSKRLKGLESAAGGVLLRANPLAGARRAQRARTVGSVLRSTANIVIGATIVLMVLAELGVNIAPFLASAGIVGVALGFGAQSLVKDFLSGTFMLLEDQYGVGDTVDLGEVSGTVEEVALRVTKVRDASGTLWFIRNGEILRTGNKTQEWGRAMVEVRVAYWADVDAVRAALLVAAEDVGRDPVLGTYFLEPPEVTGIEVMTAEALHLKVQVKTQAAMQWEVARALRARVRVALSDARIPLAGAQQVVVLDHSPAEPDDDAGAAPSSEDRRGAAATATTPRGEKGPGSPA